MNWAQSSALIMISPGCCHWNRGPNLHVAAKTNNITKRFCHITTSDSLERYISFLYFTIMEINMMFHLMAEDEFWIKNWGRVNHFTISNLKET